jgi:hypothetical protein
MKLKKYNQYVKEDLEPMLGEVEGDINTEMENDIDNFEAEDNFEDEENFEEDGFEEDGFEDEDEMEEEEGDEYKGTLLLKELAERLGSEVVNNTIEYNGQKINYYSETEAFHVGKMKFDTVDEVVDHLTK